MPDTNDSSPEQPRAEPRPVGSGLPQDRTVTLPIAAIGSLAVSIASSLGSGVMYASQTEHAAKEWQVKLEARLDAIALEVRRGNEQALAGIATLEREAAEKEGRIRALELWRAQEDVRRQIGAGK